MISSAKTVDEYIAAVPEERKATVTSIRKLILENLSSGFEEVINWGMICYEVPLSSFKDTYNKKPLMYIGLASQKNYMVLHLPNLYMSSSQEEFKKAFEATGKKLNMGKGCVRFNSLEDLPLELIAKRIAGKSADEYVQDYQRLRKQS